ncbi:hypothetical protein Pla52o_57030 [Novipirellula galeiformis]|uniref:Uncharacterized protein n=1 Tax=Novipirellula galeiformis TaxID=2528004 RepID=A0A5C6BGD6_9BACT|nr:hypothetical protein [Novipirellula galeiformis]TWU10329.1 hypothetical protein Pla52o_57030 [Novipirellula galeiformis]
MKPFRISLSTLFLLVAIAALTIALLQSRLRTAHLEAEINSLTPLRELDIAAQVEAATAAVGVPATVNSLAYDPAGPTYLVSYAYHAPDTGARQTSSFLLTYQGDGKYSGHLRTEPYLREEPDEKGERGMPVVVWNKENTVAPNAGG